MNQTSQPNSGTEIQERLKAVLGNQEQSQDVEVTPTEEIVEEQPEELEEPEEAQEFEGEPEHEDVEDEGLSDYDEYEDEEDEAVELEPAPKETYTVNPHGEEQEVTLEQLKSGFMMEADYRKKTAELKQDREKLTDEYVQAEKVRTEYIEKLDHIMKITESQVPTQAEMDEYLANEDTSSYLKGKQKIDDAKNVWLELDRAKGEALAQQQRDKAEAVVKCQETLKQTMPDIMTEEGSSRLINYLNGKGVTNDALQNIVDPVSYELAEKARLWDEMQSKVNVKGKKVHTAPKYGSRKKAMKAKVPVSRTKLAKSKAKLKKTGSKSDAQQAIKALFNQKKG